MTTPLEPDRGQIEAFFDALFRHAGHEGYASLRAFSHDNKPLASKIWKTPLADRRHVIDVAVDMARRAANDAKPAVFCPPIAVLNGSSGQAREQDLFLGLAISVECDEHPNEARQRLQEILGEATAIVKSGGVWVNGGDEPEDKLHLHWRLAKPAKGAGDLAKLKRARDLAATIIGGDPSSKTIVHPLRWPGSFHRKDKNHPRLCEFFSCNPDREIDLDQALAALEAAAPRQQPKSDGAGGGGADWQILFDNIREGRSLHDSLRDLAAKMIVAGTKPGAAVNQLRAFMETSAAPHDDRWRIRFDDIPRLVDSAVAKLNEPPEPPDDNVVNLDKERGRRTEDMAAEVERLAKLPTELDYIADKKEAAKKLKITPSELDKLVKARRVKPPKGDFEMRKDGLYRRENGEVRFVSQPFEVAMTVRDLSLGDQTSSGAGVTVKFKDWRDGASREATVSIGHLHQDANSAVSILGDCGFDMEGTKTARQDLAEFLISAKPKAKSSVVRRTGWINGSDEMAFVLPDRVIGIETDERLIWPPEAGPSPYGQGGSLDDWRRHVATPAGSHRMLKFAISLSFAAALLKIARSESGGFHEYGDSSKGKSVSQSVAASVWGSGNPEGPYVQTWNKTLNAFEEACVRFCNAPLILDELGQASRPDLAKVPYAIAGGAGKGRLNRASEAMPIRQWRTLFLSSGEASFEAMVAKEQGGDAHAGQLVRIIDIRIAEDEGRGVFELYTDFNPARFAEKIKRASATHFGTAGPEFVRLLIERKISPERVQKMIDDFADEALGDANGGQVGRVAKRFELIAAGGELAIELGVAPWPKDSAKQAALDLFEFWIADRGGTGPQEKVSDIARVRRVLESDGEARFEDPWASEADKREAKDDAEETAWPTKGPNFPRTVIERRPVPNRLGFRKGEGKDRLWYFLPEQFRKIVAPRKAEDVARHLFEIAALEAADGRNLQKTARVPGMEKQRYYIITPAIFEGRIDDDGRDDDGKATFEEWPERF